MSNTNTVTISESCLSALPAGDYHHSLFEGIDIFKPNEIQNMSAVRADMRDASDEVVRLTKRNELIDEQLDFARELICEMQQSLKLSKSLLSKKLKALIQESSFDL